MLFTITDIWLFLGINIYVVFLIAITEILAKKSIVSDETSRKFLHILVGLVVLFLPYFSNKYIASIIPALYIIGNYFMSPVSPIEKLKMNTFEAGHAYGTILYPISLLVLTYFFFDYPALIAIGFFPLCFGDGMAALIGTKWPIKEFKGIGGTKSIGGSLAFVVSTFVSLLLVSAIFDLTILPIIIAPLVGILLELISIKGWDNLIIPIGTVMITTLLMGIMF